MDSYYYPVILAMILVYGSISYAIFYEITMTPELRKIRCEEMISYYQENKFLPENVTISQIKCLIQNSNPAKEEKTDVRILSYLHERCKKVEEYDSTADCP